MMGSFKYKSKHGCYRPSCVLNNSTNGYIDALSSTLVVLVCFHTSAQLDCCCVHKPGSHQVEVPFNPSTASQTLQKLVQFNLDVHQWFVSVFTITSLSAKTSMEMGFLKPVSSRTSS